MKKIIIILTTILILIIGVIGFMLVTQEAPVPTDSEPISTTSPVTTFPASDDVPKDHEVIFENNEGEIVEVDAFLDHPSVTPDTYNQGYYFLGNTFMPNEEGVQPHYVITYDSAEEFFNIVLLKEPLRQSRFEAEAYLRSVLNMSDASICSLEYTLSVPAYVNREMAGVDYRFSFCDDAVVI